MIISFPYLLLVLSSVSLVSCTAVSQPPTPPPPQASVCRTIHCGSELSLNRPLQTIRVPVSRESATQGFTTLILPTSAGQEIFKRKNQYNPPRTVTKTTQYSLL